MDNARTQRLNVLVCSGASCISNDSLKVKEALLAEVGKFGLGSEVKIIETGCMGPCELGPVILVYPEGILYKKVQIDDVRDIVEEHFLKGRPVERLLYKSSKTEELVRKHQEIDYFQKQQKIVLKNCGSIDPESIDEYIAVGGYEALGKALTEMNPDTVLNEIMKSGLRGRGGGGFSTYLKWKFTKEVQEKEKYVVCNADEGDPGAFMDRSVIEGDPHTLIEGMAIAGYVVGAQHGYVYVRAEYPLAIVRLKKAIKQAEEYGFLGNNIFGTNFSFNLEVRMGAGAFVCGEETALIHSIEGKRGTPRPRPPYPAVSGVWEKPTVLNNVETYANVRHIVLNGGAWMSAIGTETSKGTKVFALSGTIKNTGLAEVPMGTTIRELIYDIGGGAPGGKKIKAVQLGGPSGGCIKEEYFDTKIDYESLLTLGAMMGSGGIIAMDDTTCMVNTAKFFIEFSAFESCGKCVPCRIGLKQMQHILQRITSGKGEDGDIEKLIELGQTIKKASLCGLGQTAPNPVLSTIRYFREEYEEHIREKKCRALVCRDLLTFTITDRCRGCTVCAQKCPTKVIAGERGKLHVIDQAGCIQCGTCYDVCPFNAIDKTTGIEE